MEKEMTVCRYKGVLVPDRFIPGGIYMIRFGSVPRLFATDGKLYPVHPDDFELVDLNGN